MPAPAPCASVIIQLHVSGIMYSADTVPIEDETSRDKDCMFVLPVIIWTNLGKHIFCRYFKPVIIRVKCFKLIIAITRFPGSAQYFKTGSCKFVSFFINFAHCLYSKGEVNYSFMLCNYP